jgi:hypothetical protein
MVITDLHKLRDRANNCRILSLDGDDIHLKVALLQLAEEFEQEAVQIEAELVKKHAIEWAG